MNNFIKDDLYWKVVPITWPQTLDVREEDIFGDFRLCDTNRGGGGYDQFPTICQKRLEKDFLKIDNLNKQFIVQLYGCVLDCPYCYVTKYGVFGNYIPYGNYDLLNSFKSSGTKVFHLMGGSPAIYLDKWYSITRELPKDCVFTSDLLLQEGFYRLNWLLPLKYSNCVLAVNIKGGDPEEFYQNTRKVFNSKLFWYNLDILVQSGVEFYFTFTNVESNIIIDLIKERYGQKILEDAYHIELHEYEATKAFNQVEAKR